MAARVLRTRRAAADLVDIARWTIRTFGPLQARRYVAIIEAALVGLGRMPEITSARLRPDLVPSIWAIRAGLAKAPSRHILVFTYDAQTSPATATVLRVLHDSMELRLHLLASNDPT